MNIEIANRLVELRKKAGLSQEQLAERLGLSRQAVSKWERAEASPDTDNLILLARLYGVSLDELLSTEQKDEEIVEENKEKIEEEAKQKEEGVFRVDNGGDHVYIGPGGIHIKDANGDEVHIDQGGLKIVEGHNGETLSFGDHEKHKSFEALYWPISLLLSTAAYMLMGFFWTEHSAGWAVGWVLYLLVVAFGTLGEAIIKKKMSSFAFPLLLAALYCGLGIGFDLYGLPSFWHPWWVIFLLIPVYYTIAEIVDRHEKKEAK